MSSLNPTEPSPQQLTDTGPNRRRLPDDILDLPMAESSETEEISHDHKLPHIEEGETPRLYPFFRLALLIAVIVLVVVFLLSERQRGNMQNWLRSESQPPVTNLIEVYNGVALLSEQNGESSRILVQQVDQASWLVVSRDDYTAKHPKLSLDGKMVAYRTEQGDEAIRVVPLVGNQSFVVTDSQIKDSGESKNVQRLEICEWTELAWSPDNKQLAFFACSSNPARSLALITALGQPTSTISLMIDTDLEILTPRTLAWLTNNQLIVVNPFNKGSTEVKTFNVP